MPIMRIIYPCELSEIIVMWFNFDNGGRIGIEK